MQYAVGGVCVCVRVQRREKPFTHVPPTGNYCHDTYDKHISRVSRARRPAHCSLLRRRSSSGRRSRSSSGGQHRRQQQQQQRAATQSNWLGCASIATSLASGHEPTPGPLLNTSRPIS